MIPSLATLIVSLVVLPLVPGAYNPAVTQATIRTTICVPGWTRTVRPPSAYTSTLKRIQLANAKLTDKNPRHYEEDHEVSLSLGGAPYSHKNLWLQPIRQALRDDVLERYWHREICAGRMTLAQARRTELVWKRTNG